MYSHWILYLTSDGKKGEEDFDIVSLDLWLLGFDCGVKPKFLLTLTNQQIFECLTFTLCSPNTMEEKKNLSTDDMLDDPQMFANKKQISEWTKGWTKYILSFQFVFVVSSQR